MTKEYVLTNNCKIVVDKGQPLKLSRADAKKAFKDKDIKLDERLFIISVNNTYDEVQYLNYLNLLRNSSNRMNISGSVVNNFTSLLDLGYVPVWIPPTFFDEDNELADRVLQSIKSKKLLNYIKERQLRLTGTQVSSRTSDIWLSRLDVRTLFKGKMINIPLGNIFKEVIR